MGEHEFYSQLAVDDIDQLASTIAGKQPLDADLTAIAGLSPSNGDLILRVAGAWSNSPLNKSAVGLGNVDNTSDASKPVSLATLTALNGKASSVAGAPIGGSTGQLLAKSSNIDHAMAWTDVSAAGLPGFVDCSSMTTAAEINTASAAAPLGSTIWLGRRGTGAELLIDTTIVLRPGQRLMGAGGRAMLTRVKAGASFPAGAPLLAAQGYLGNATTADNPISVIGVHLDANGKTGSHGLVIYNFWSHVEDVQVTGCDGAAAHGIHATDRAVNGTSVSTNSHSENTFVRCRFYDFTNKASGFWAECTNGLNNSNQDGYLVDSFFAALGGYGAHITRAAGWTIENNHLYGIGWDAIRLTNCYGTKVIGNYVEDFGGENLAAPGAPTFGYYAGITLASVLNTRASVVMGNTVSVNHPSSPTGNRWSCFVARAGSGQTRANVVMVANTATWATGTAPSTTRAHAWWLGEPGDTGRMLYVEWSGDQIEALGASWWAGTRTVNAMATVAEPQPLDADLTTIAALTATTDNVIQSVGSAWASRTPAQLKTSLALAKGDVGLGSVDNTSDTAKPVSTDTQTALNAKASTTHASAHAAGGGDALTASAINAQRDLTITASKTANYTAVDGDIVICNAAGGAFTVTLPTAATDLVIVVTKTDTSSNKITLAKQVGDNWLNGTPVPLLLQQDVRWFYGTSGGWVQVEPITSVKQFPPVALTPGAAPALDASLGTHFTLAMAQNPTIGIPSNPTEGQVIAIAAKSDGTARTLSLNAGTGGFLFGSTITALSQTAANKTDVIQAMYNTIANKWWVTGYVKGY